MKRPKDKLPEALDYLVTMEGRLLNLMVPEHYNAAEGLNKKKDPSLIEVMAMITVNVLLNSAELSDEVRSELAFMTVVAHRNLEKAATCEQQLLDVRTQLAQIVKDATNGR